MKSLVTISAAALLSALLGACVTTDTADTGAPTTAPAAAPATDSGQQASNDEGLVCTFEAPTGSRFGRKICTTAIQRQEDQDRVRDAQARSTLSRPAGL